MAAFEGSSAEMQPQQIWEADLRLGFGHVIFEMLVSYPSGKIKEAVECIEEKVESGQDFNLQMPSCPQPLKQSSFHFLTFKLESSQCPPQDGDNVRKSLRTVATPTRYSVEVSSGHDYFQGVYFLKSTASQSPESRDLTCSYEVPEIQQLNCGWVQTHCNKSKG